MSTTFDTLAEGYNSSLPKLPSKFINHLQFEFDLNLNDRILDLGCGSGFLTLPLSLYSDEVYGLDSSSQMLAIAKTQDKQGKVKWILNNTESYQFPYSWYKLIIAFESFHLFHSTNLLVDNIWHSLRVGGFFAIGWVEFHWEELFFQIIVDSFRVFGIDWGNTPNPATIDIQSLMQNESLRNSNVKRISVQVWEETDVLRIAKYLTNIEKASPLNPSKQYELENEIITRITQFSSDKIIKGYSNYIVYYFQKLI